MRESVYVPFVLLSTWVAKSVALPERCSECVADSDVCGGSASDLHVELL
jgi:hypothetical protein